MGKHPQRLNRSNRSVRHLLLQQDGFTLVEMLVVITIIGLVVGLVGQRVLNHLSESKTNATKIQIEGFAQALDPYYLDNGSYPATNVGLTGLVQRPKQCRTPEWTLPERQCGSERPLGQTIFVCLPGSAWASL